MNPLHFGQSIFPSRMFDSQLFGGRAIFDPWKEVKLFNELIGKDVLWGLLIRTISYNLVHRLEKSSHAMTEAGSSVCLPKEATHDSCFYRAIEAAIDACHHWVLLCYPIRGYLFKADGNKE